MSIEPSGPFDQQQMNYDLMKTVEGRQEFNEYRAMQYGDMPPGLLMSRYEETNMGEDEQLYNDYARTTITDWTEDTNKFTYEEPRGGVNARYGRLQLIHYGTRGNVDTPWTPEIFLGFAGDEDRDPRGINVDPDFKQFTAQEEARMRFIRFTSDACDQVTGGGRSEDQQMKDQQTLFKANRRLIKVFDRQIDGRREGIRRTYYHASNVPKQMLIQSYGDKILNNALTPQNRANMVCKQIIRDTAAHRAESADMDFAFAKYAQTCRRAKLDVTQNNVRTAVTDMELADADGSKLFKTAGILMSNLVRAKKQTLEMMGASNIDLGQSKSSVQMKTAPISKDLNLVLRQMVHDGDYESCEDPTTTFSVALPQQRAHLGRITEQNHYLPAHYYLNAELMFKSVAPGADTKSITKQIVTDASAPDIRDENTSAAKTAKMRLAHGRKLKTDNDDDRDESKRTVNYRQKCATLGLSTVGYAANDAEPYESDPTQSRKVNHTNYTNVNKNNSAQDMKYAGNASAERHTRAMGSKYTTRFVDRDSTGGELAALN